MALQRRSRDDIRSWLREFHYAADSLTTFDLHKFYSKNSTLCYANNQPVHGLENIVSFFQSVFPLLESMKHETLDFDAVGNKIYLIVRITYEVKDDPAKEEFTVPAMGVCYLKTEGEEEGKMDKFEVYLDASPVFGRIIEIAAAKSYSSEET